jgi:N-carbamoylputrescine amidase
MAVPRSVRVAAVQVASHAGAVVANLARAEPWVVEAARGGAKLVLCPEFLASGYVYDEVLWSSAERRGGPTEAWLSRLSSAHRIHVGASYLEAEGDDFYNTFALAAPDGSIAGRVRKESLPGFESWFFRSSDESKVLDTELGRLAVGICQDSHTASFFRRVRRDGPDLILMPHSAPLLTAGAELARESLREIAPFYARTFGVPVVLANKAHTPSQTPLPGLPGFRVRFSFAGLSSVCSAGGGIVDRLADGEGIAIGDVLVDPTNKLVPELPADGYWSHPPPGLPRLTAAMYVGMERLGKRAYARNRRRPLAARAVARGG